MFGAVRGMTARDGDLQESRTQSSAAVISCSGLGKVFRVTDEGASWKILFKKGTQGKTVTAVHDVSLRVPKGKFVGVLGRNGAGKSTLLRLLAGVYSPDSGSIATRGRLSGLFELGGFGNPFLTGRQFAERRLRIEGAHSAALPALLTDIRDFSELDAYFDRRIITYSTGMAARLYFAVATALEYDIYLIDEILSVGDEHFQAKCWKRLRERFAKGASGVLVTHDWSAILKICEEAHILDHGRIVFSDRADRAIQHYLQIPRATAEDAAFCSQSPAAYHCEHGKNLHFSVDVELASDVAVALSYSVELLRIGAGWEIILLENHIPVASERGRYKVDIAMESPMLAPGRYVLNLFLTSPRETYGTPEFRIFDTRSWTRGDGIDLIVHGDPIGGVTSFPVTWSSRGV